MVPLTFSASFNLCPIMCFTICEAGRPTGGLENSSSNPRQDCWKSRLVESLYLYQMLSCLAYTSLNCLPHELLGTHRLDCWTDGLVRR
ncbi:hypothetical protein K461DRAFT_57088 [Myriangium duriaei CBS 260.36]|uniref:Uncharacterized protein n=1 Tax=Myriangium duriaei CBS 260.36 TaxID=1168546 RepID=A0A9P4IYI1_9PEZI|nr:hypothetical protein K461DRAFT_57088 [Myriangium duriaei CBS 260.36]